MVGYRKLPALLQCIFLFCVYLIISFACFNIFSGQAILGTCVSNVFCTGLFYGYYKSMDFDSVYTIEKENLVSCDLKYFLGLLLLAVWFFSQTASICLYTYVGDEVFKTYSQNLVSGPAALTLILPIILAPICEELLIRGLVYQLLKVTLSDQGLAFFLQAFVFALLHGTLVHMFSGFLAGLFFALVLDWTGRLSYSILAHSLYNIGALGLTGKALPAFLVHPAIVIPGFLGLVVLLFYLNKQVICEE